MFDTKKDALKEIFSFEGITGMVSNKITADQLLECLSLDSYTMSNELGISASAAVAIVHRLWPNKPKTSTKVCTYLFNIYGYKYCSNCKKVLEVENFSKNISRPGGLNTHCKSCYLETTRDYQREYQKTRKALKLDRVPSWANLDKIKEIYDNCPVGYHVDHIVPLQGKNVSGFHVEYNLQYLLAEDNLKKSNKFEV